MITGVFGAFASERLAPWLFALETLAALVIAALFWMGVLQGGLWPVLGFAWYAIYSVLLYFHWDRRRTLKEEETWAPSPVAKAVAVACFGSLTALGGGLAYWSFGVEIRVAVIGLVIMAIGILQLVAIVRRGWPRLGR